MVTDMSHCSVVAVASPLQPLYLISARGPSRAVRRSDQPQWRSNRAELNSQLLAHESWAFAR